MAPLDVFEPAVVLGVVGRGNGGLVVTVLLGGRGLGGGDDLAVLDVRLELGLKATELKTSLVASEAAMISDCGKRRAQWRAVGRCASVRWPAT